jgi:hypothetical protein
LKERGELTKRSAGNVGAGTGSVEGVSQSKKAKKEEHLERR